MNLSKQLRPDPTSLGTCRICGGQVRYFKGPSGNLMEVDAEINPQGQIYLFCVGTFREHGRAVFTEVEILEQKEHIGPFLHHSITCRAARDNRKPAPPIEFKGKPSGLRIT